MARINWDLLKGAYYQAKDTVLNIVAPTPKEGKIHLQRLDNVVWITAPGSDRLKAVIKSIPRSSYDRHLRKWSIPYEGLRRFAILILKDPELYRSYWPMIGLEEELIKFDEEFTLREEIRTQATVDVLPKYLHHKDHKLRMYQYQAALWMVVAYKCLLSFDMGLGKTISTISALKILVQHKNRIMRMLVVVPAGLKYNWVEEVTKFSNFSYQVIDGTPSERAAQIAMMGEHFINIVSYEILRSDLGLFKKYSGDIEVLVADEANYVKNPKAQRTKAFHELSNLLEYTWLLTGTPLENGLQELWGLMLHIDPMVLGESLPKFENIYCVEGPDGRPLKGRVRHLQALKDRVAPYMFRRRKADVEKELPEKIFSTVLLDMSTYQRNLYRKLHKEAEVMLADGSVVKYENALTMILRLQQVCDHPVLVGDHGCSSEDVPKVEWLLSNLESSLSEEKIIIFTQYKTMAYKLADLLKDYNPLMINGDTDAMERIQRVHQFQEGESRAIILTKAGARGLNLTKASVVLFYDQVWNPQLMNQIIDRSHRIGNTQEKLLIISLVTRRTIEEEIQKTLELRSNLFKAVIDDEDLDEPEVKEVVLNLNFLRKLVGIGVV